MTELIKTPHYTNFFNQGVVRKWMEEENLKKREVSYLTREGKMIKVDFSSSEDLKNKYKQIDNKNIKGWYITPNPTDGKGRKQENFTHREWLIVDIDTQREKNTNATNQEIEKAFNVAGEIEQVTNLFGDYKCSIWPIPYIALSGNGVHLLYRCDLENNEEHNNLVNKWYSLLDKAFSTTEAKIDTSMSSIAQLTKLYGTWSRKAPEQENRPWRQSELREILYDEMTWELVLGYSSDFSKIIDINKLKEMTEDLEKIIAGKNKKNNFKWLENWCEEHEIEYRVKRTGVMFRHCPFYHEHQSEWCCGVMCDKATSVDNFVFHCFGNHCKENGKQKHTWKELRALVENGEVAPEVAQEETRNNNTELPSPINLTDESIVAKKEYWATNISSLDEALGGGFARGELSIVTGFLGGGKTTFLHQMVAYYIAQGHSVGYWQGDRSSKEVKANFIQIGMSEEDMRKINFYSRYQHNLTIEQLTQIAGMYEVFVMDSFSAFQSSLGGDYLVTQQVVDNLSSVAKKKNNIILVVAHQGTHDGLCHQEKIASAKEIKQKADVIVAVERYDESFARKVLFQLGKESDFYSNLLIYSKSQQGNPHAFISIFKNQTEGELMRIPLLFEKEKKLFKNYQN